jgi:hypothetical protein
VGMLVIKNPRDPKGVYLEYPATEIDPGRCRVATALFLPLALSWR